jgi:PEGA domain
MRWVAACCAVVMLLLVGRARGQPAEGADSAGEAEVAETPEAREAKEAFVQGAQLAREAHWAQALASFERAAALKPHAVTTYNIGACERAIGRYTRARRAFEKALAQHQADGGTLPDALLTQTHAFVAEIDGLLARARVTVIPASATIAIDGRPLERIAPSPPQGQPGPRATVPLFIANTREPGAGEKVVAEQFDVLLDPGAHVLTLTRHGFAPALLNKTFSPGAREDLRLELDRLPAHLDVRSNEEGAIVYLDGRDVGTAPVQLSRPAGHYHVLVEKDGFVSYEAQVDVGPGEQSNLRATLIEESVPILERWWFWTSAAAVVATSAVVTWAATRPEPEPAPYDGGSSGWVVFPQVRF